MKKLLIQIFIFTILVLPAISFAQGIVPPCDTNCGFYDFMALINEVIEFALFKLALPIAAIMFAYAGIKLVTSGGSEEARSSAKSIFANTAIGIIIAAAAFLIISLILSTLGYDGSWIGFN